MQPLRLCVFLAFIAVLRCYELSQNLAEFYCVLNGNFSNSEQVGKDGGDHTLMELTAQPVIVPALSPIPVVFLEHSDNGVLIRVYILIVTEGQDGVIFTTPYNISGNTQTKPGAFRVDQIKSLTLDNLQGQPDCKDAFARSEPFIFTINFQNCRAAKVNGTWPSYGSTLTCGDVTSVIPAGSAEIPTLVPYHVKRHGSNLYRLRGERVWTQFVIPHIPFRKTSDFAADGVYLVFYEMVWLPLVQKAMANY